MAHSRTRGSRTRRDTITCKYLHYTYRTREGTTKIIKLPLINILIESSIGEEFRTVGLVDSGATSTLLPKEIADLLMMPYEENSIEVTGAGGIFNCKPVKLRRLVLIKNVTTFSTYRNIKVLVPEEEEILPYVILGRDYVFKRFDITFSEKRRKMVFKRRR